MRKGFPKLELRRTVPTRRKRYLPIHESFTPISCTLYLQGFTVADFKFSANFAFPLHSQVTLEGELLPFYQQELKVGGDGIEDKIFFIWPTTIVHKINPMSPLYTLSAADMLRERFEIVVILEGKLVEHIL